MRALIGARIERGGPSPRKIGRPLLAVRTIGKETATTLRGQRGKKLQALGGLYGRSNAPGLPRYGRKHKRT